MHVHGWLRIHFNALIWMHNGHGNVLAVCSRIFVRGRVGAACRVHLQRGLRVDINYFSLRGEHGDMHRLRCRFQLRGK